MNECMCECVCVNLVICRFLIFFLLWVSYNNDWKSNLIYITLTHVRNHLWYIIYTLTHIWTNLIYITNLHTQSLTHLSSLNTNIHINTFIQITLEIPLYSLNLITFKPYTTTLYQNVSYIIFMLARFLMCRKFKCKIYVYFI